MTQNKTFLRLITCLMLLSIAATTLSSCFGLDSLFEESMEDRIIGKWYNWSGKCIDIREDGSYKRDGEYGTGRWTLLDDTTIEFIDFYGDDTQVTIEEDEHGLYFNYWGKYYKDAYPSDDDDADNSPSNDNQTEAPTETEKETVVINIDPFDGIIVNVSGISPYCTLSIDNSECSDDAQNHVKYSLDKDAYKNGDTAVITASIINKSSGSIWGTTIKTDTYYELTETEYTFKIQKQPEYVTSINDLDLTYLESEMKDYIEAEKASAKESYSGYLFGCDFDNITGYVSTEVKEEYFYSLKQNKQSLFRLGDTCFNRISYVYCIDVTYTSRYNNDEKTDKMWVNVGAENVVKYPDGTIKWGSKSSEGYNFVYYSSDDSIENCVSGSITTKSSDYNIKKIA